MKYAIIESGGKQFRAVEGGTIEVDRLPIEPGANVKLEQVLLLADGESITVGTPLVRNIPVWTTVVEHFKGPKVNIFNYSPKKRIRVKIGHRQNYTRLLVEQIGGSELVKKEKVVEVKAEAKEMTPKVKAEKAKKPIKAESKAETASSKRQVSPKVTSPAKGKKPAAKAPAARGKPGTTKTPAKPSSKKTAASKAEPKKSPKAAAKK
jgi:large subunit ribosomal protein L21